MSGNCHWGERRTGLPKGELKSRVAALLSPSASAPSSPSKAPSTLSASAATSSSAVPAEHLELTLVQKQPERQRRKRFRFLRPLLLSTIQLALQEKWQIPVTQQKLFYGGRELESKKKLNFLTDGCEVLVRETPIKLRITVPLRAQPLVLSDVLLSHSMEELKYRLEGLLGIPVTQMRLQYLESLDLSDDASGHACAIVSNSLVTIGLWPDWEGMFRAITIGDFADVIAHVRAAPRGNQGWACLFMAAFLGQTPLCESLMELGYDPGLPADSSIFGCNDSQRGTGRTPIHAAAGSGHLKCLAKLVEKGAEYVVQDSRGITPEVLAKTNGHSLCADFLSKASWDRRAVDTRPPTSKSAAAKDPR
eukprot:m.184076 g.184076  ORF g.184076 m.184076 type:complete len:363 (+) comp21537_c0_seq8:7-1095(+)